MAAVTKALCGGQLVGSGSLHGAEGDALSRAVELARNVAGATPDAAAHIHHLCKNKQVCTRLGNTALTCCTLSTPAHCNTSSIMSICAC